MPRRRRRFTRSFAGTKGGRRFFWYRFSPSGVTLREAATATHSDIVLDEGLWDVNASLKNDQQRGGPRLERVIMDYGLSILAGVNFWRPIGESVIALLPEFLMWKQSDQFATIITNSASFDQTRANQRIIMDEVPLHEDAALINPNGDPVQAIRSVRGRFETKTKVRLSDGALGIAWRGFYNEGATELAGYTDWVRPTFLISLP